MKKEFLEIAPCLPHRYGRRIKIEIWCDSADVLKHLGTCTFPAGITGLTSVRPPTAIYALIKLDGVDSRDRRKAARTVLCANAPIYICRRARFSYPQIIGLPVIER